MKILLTMILALLAFTVSGHPGHGNYRIADAEAHPGHGQFKMLNEAEAHGGTAHLRSTVQPELGPDPTVFEKFKNDVKIAKQYLAYRVEKDWLLSRIFPAPVVNEVSAGGRPELPSEGRVPDFSSDPQEHYMWHMSNGVPWLQGDGIMGATIR